MARSPNEQRTLGSLSEATGPVRLDAMWSWQRLEGRPAVGETGGEQSGRSVGVRPTRVMLVDDHDIVRDGIRALLERAEDMVVCAEAATMRQAVNVADRSLPEVIIMDVRLPDGSGIEATREIRAAHPDVKVLMLTSFADDQALFASILAGAAGYVLKQINAEDFAAGGAHGGGRGQPAGRGGDRPGAGAAAVGQASAAGRAAGQVEPAGGADPAAGRRRADQPADRGGAGPGGEDRQELHVQRAEQAAGGPPRGGRRLPGPPHHRRELSPGLATLAAAAQPRGE